MNTEQSTKSHLMEWTILVYIAGDNNLEAFGRKDLDELKNVGSTDEVAVLAQFDGMSDQVARRYHLTREKTLDANCIAELPEVNTGDPDALADSVLWAVKQYPAKRYGLVLWNHGAGWKDDDIYRSARHSGLAGEVMRAQVRSMAASKTSRALFSTTLDRLVQETIENERAVLFDDSSADFLDNIEMRNVLRRVVDKIGQPLDLLGFDACLMNLVEVGYQVREFCQIVVGSQENEPSDGWPYNLALAELVKRPSLSGAELARNIVDTYVDYYRSHRPKLPVTQSAVRTDGMDAIVKSVGALATMLVDNLDNPNMLGALFLALRSAQSFKDRDYLDLTHFCELLAQSNAHAELASASQVVVDLLSDQNSPVIAKRSHGPGMSHANGLSIYLPVRILSPLYKELEFAKHCPWNTFLERLVKPV